MKKRQFIGFMTILAGLPGLGGLLLLLNDIGEINFTLIMVILAVLCRGFCGVAGGVLLWRGNKLGYQLSTVAWGFMVIVAFMAFYQLFTGPYFTSFEFTSENKLFWSVFGKSAGKLLWGIPFLYIMIRDLNIFTHKNTTEATVEPS